MTLAATPSSGRSSASPLALFAAEPAFAAAGAFLGLSLAPTLAAMAFDDRLFQGENVWVKPIKFQIALAIYLLSLAFFARFMPARLVRSRAWRVYAGVVIAAIFAELAWIGGAAVAGTASHFNVSTPMMQQLYGVMGILAVTLTSASLVAGVAVWLNRGSALEPPVRLAVALGLVLTFVLTIPVAGTMASMPGHFVGTPPTGAVLPLLGWSREVGDLRVPHFLATHAMHAVPLAGLLVSGWSSARRATAVVAAAAAGYVALVAAAFAGALAGMPAIPLF